MNNQDIQLIIDLLIYLDMCVNWHYDIYLDNDIAKSMAIISELNSKHREFEHADKRHELITEMIDKLRELKDYEYLNNFFNKLKERYGVDDLDYLEMIVQKYLLNCQ